MATKAIALLESAAPYSPSRMHDAPYLLDQSGNKDETHDAYDERTWREKAHVKDDGRVFIPGHCFKLAVSQAAALAKERVKGKGLQEWGKIFASGVLVFDDVILPIKKDDLGMVKINANANGRPGAGTRVVRRFPLIPSWSGTVEFIIANSDIKEDVFRRYLTNAGILVGLGRWRPENRGSNGRFRVKELKWGLPFDV